LVVVLAFGFSHGDGATAAVGAATSIFGAAVLLSVGCAIATIRAVSKQIARIGAGAKEPPAFLPAALRDEFGIAWIFGLVGLAIAWTLVGLAGIVSPGSSVAVGWYVIGASAWILVVPHTSVTVGAFQALDRDRFNAMLALVTGALQVAAVALILLLRLPLEHSIFLVAASGSALAVGALAYRLRVLSQLAQGRVSFLRFGRIANAWKEVSLRAAAGADGVVYMTVFLLATTIATRSSVASGAAVALAVSVMRLLIIPIKQLGLVGGRLLAQGEFETPQVGLRTIRVTAAFACVVAALGIVVWGAFPNGMPFGLATVLAAQLLLEPVAGVQFTALKVAVGPEAGIRLLLICYWIVAPLLLALSAVLGLAEPWMIWLILLAVRLAFAAGVMHITSTKLSTVARAHLTRATG
jgi:hypothetical protein